MEPKIKFSLDSKNVGPESLRPREVPQNGDLSPKPRALARFSHHAAPGSQKGSRSSSLPFPIIEGMGKMLEASPLRWRESKWVKKHVEQGISWGTDQLYRGPVSQTTRSLLVEPVQETTSTVEHGASIHQDMGRESPY